MAVKEYWQNYINGEWVDGGSGRLPVENPSTGEHLADVARADAGDVDRAVSAARACHESHVLTSDKPIVRGRMIRQMGEYLQDHEAEIVEILTLEAGKPLAESRIEVEGAARYLEFYGNIAESNGGREIPMGDQYYNFTVHEPYGVSAQIIPWNFPLDIIARGIGPALAAGNASVSSFAKRARPFRVFAAFANSGAIVRQGPHHAAQKSTTSGISSSLSALRRTSRDTSTGFS